MFNQTLDVNECSAATNYCDTNAICTITEGEYTCVCKSGYAGDGKSCLGITT